MIKKGDEIRVSVIDLNSEGKGISKPEDSFVIFSEGTLPGDDAIIKIVRKKSRYAEARLVEILMESPDRITAKCRYFGICGGCKIQNYNYDKQIEFKTNVVKNAFERIGGFNDLNIPKAIRSDEIFFYRNKMEFSFSDDEWKELPPDSKIIPQIQVGKNPPSPPLQGGNCVDEVEINPDEKNTNPPCEGGQGGLKDKSVQFALGLHVPKFHSKIIDINECFLQSGLSNDVLNFTRDFFKNKNINVYTTKTQAGFLRFLIIRQSKNTNDVMVNLITYDYDKELMDEYSVSIKNIFPAISTLINSVSQKKAQVAVGENEYVLFGNGNITEKLKTSEGKEYVFKISPQSFFQTNTLQAQKLFDIASSLGEFNQSDNVLDLYCGAGAISIFISGIVNKILGVELSGEAIRDARSNALLNNVRNVEFIISDIKDFLEAEEIKNYNKLILDPPRSGLHPKICEILSETDFERIIYVSCNPHTQARDLQIVCSKEKYVIDKIQPVDMFPHTYHVENVVSLKRNV